MFKLITAALLIFASLPESFCQPTKVQNPGIIGDLNFSVQYQDASGLSLLFSIEGNLNEIVKNVSAHHLGNGRLVAVPSGANTKVEIKSSKYKEFELTEIAFPGSYFETAFDLNELARINGSFKFRGMDVSLLEVNPFQYDSKTKKIHVYNKLELELIFTGGNGHFGEDRLRNRYWDQIYESLLLNYKSLPVVKNNKYCYSTSDGAEYLIITPDNPAYLTWADSLKYFRNLQGIKTDIVTLSDIGGNDVNMIEDFIDDAYNSWTIPPAAVLILADYGTGPATGNGIVSPVYSNYCVSDNIYADVDGDQLPDIVLSRIPAQNGTDLESIISRILKYERVPPGNNNFYNNPLCVSGWQSSGIPVMCSEIIFGFYEIVLNKQPLRQYSGYGGGAPANWPDDPYSLSLFAIFGPNGLGYIPATPSHLTNWNGSAAGINNAINNGTFAVYYKGSGSTFGWGEPSYVISDLAGLNNNYPPFVFSITSLSGKFNSLDDSFAEAFLKQEHGALGLIAATEVIYSFVSGDYSWGLYDYLWPDFFPEPLTLQTYRWVLPAFANASAKYFLQGNNSPFYNQQNKEVTYNLFHHFGDSFSFIYTEIPQYLSVIHDSLLLAGEETFTVSADENSQISLTVKGEILAVETGTGLPLDISIPPQSSGDTMIVTVTKQNFFRYHTPVEIVTPSGINDKSNFAPLEFALFQNHPNPFNPITNIKFTIPKDVRCEMQEVKLKVYDVLGNEVATLVNEELSPGEYEVEFGRNLINQVPTSGVYFYQLRSDSFVETKKMLLLK